MDVFRANDHFFPHLRRYVHGAGIALFSPTERSVDVNSGSWGRNDSWTRLTSQADNHNST